jgi:hypothetical protein
MIRDKMWATTALLPCKLPGALCPQLLEDIVSSCNCTTNKNASPLTPREDITGVKISVGIFRYPFVESDATGIVIGRDHSSKDAIRLNVIGTSSIFHTNRFEPIHPALSRPCHNRRKSRAHRDHLGSTRPTDAFPRASNKSIAPRFGRRLR